MDGPRPRALLYARVSTDRQAERYGLEAQVVGLRERAAERGYAIARDGDHDAFADDGYSGGDLSRPALERLRRAVRDGRADVVLVYDPDRLSRSLADLLVVADEFEGAGVRLEFITQEMDASPEGRLFFSIRGAVAEFEKAKIRERMMRGKREKARQGKVIQPKSLPAWLQSADGGATVTLDPHWAEVARLIWRLFLDEGLTLRKIAERLTLLGYRTPSGGTIWRQQVVQTWLTNPAAKGELCQLRFHSIEPRRRRKPVTGMTRRKRVTSQTERPAEEWSRIPVPALVDPATWQAAQERLQRNKALASRNAHRFYLLSGMLTCGECGRHLAGIYKRGQHSAGRYYHCNGNGRAHLRVDGSGACNLKLVNANRIEEQVWEHIAGLLRNPDLLEEQLHRRKEAGSPTRDGLEVEVRQAKTRLAAIPAEMDRLVEGYGKGFIPDDLMRSRMITLQDEKKALTEQVEAIDREIARLQEDARAEDAALAFARRMAAGIDALDEQGRRELLRQVVREIVVYGHRVRIRTVLPGGDDGDDGPDSANRLSLPASGRDEAPVAPDAPVASLAAGRTCRHDKPKRNQLFQQARQRYAFSQLAAIRCTRGRVRDGFGAKRLNIHDVDGLGKCAYRAVNRMAVGKARNVSFKGKNRLRSWESDRRDGGMRFQGVGGTRHLPGALAGAQLVAPR